MVVDQVNVWLGTSVSLVMAVAGLGAISLVVGRLVGACVSGILFLHYSPLPYRFGFDRKFVRDLLAFGLPLAGSSVIVFLVAFVDQVMIGSMLGATLLGYYVLAANLASWPVAMVSQPLRSVAPVLFSRMQREPRLMRTAFVQVLRPLAAVALPVCLLMGAMAPDLISFVYGAQWAPAAPVLRWLALLAAMRIFFELTYDYLVVTKRSAAILRLQVVWIIALVPALWWGIERGGIEGAAAAMVVVTAVVSLPMYLFELRRVESARARSARQLLCRASRLQARRRSPRCLPARSRAPSQPFLLQPRSVSCARDWLSGHTATTFACGGTRGKGMAGLRLRRPRHDIRSGVWKAVEGACLPAHPGDRGEPDERRRDRGGGSRPWTRRGRLRTGGPPARAHRTAGSTVHPCWRQRETAKSQDRSRSSVVRPYHRIRRDPWLRVATNPRSICCGVEGWARTCRNGDVHVGGGVHSA